MHRLVHLDNEVAAGVKVRGLHHHRETGRLEHCLDPLGPLSVGLVVADEEVIHFASTFLAEMKPVERE